MCTSARTYQPPLSPHIPGALDLGYEGFTRFSGFSLRCLTGHAHCGTLSYHWLNTADVLRGSERTSVNPLSGKTSPVARNRLHVDEHASGQNRRSPMALAFGV